MIRFFENRMAASGLVNTSTLLLAARDDKVYWNNRDNRYFSIISEFLEHSSAAGLIFSRPSEPYATIIDFFGQTEEDTIYPRDCETRTFFHSFPIVRELSVKSLRSALKAGKAVIIPKIGILAVGSMTLEQAYVSFSSICFACFVKFYNDYLKSIQYNSVSDRFRSAFFRTLPYIPEYANRSPQLLRNILVSEEKIYSALVQAGKATVELGLVDSFFGNISCITGNTLYISQTGASLDYLTGCVDPCKLDNSSCAGITASSEFSAHRAIYTVSDGRVILHGHPRFSVIMSMICKKESDCPYANECHKKCPHKRTAGDIPIVPGEVGTGETGLCKTVPAAFTGNRGVIVHGHGVFTTGKKDFNEALQALLDIERLCRADYFNQAGVS